MKNSDNKFKLVQAKPYLFLLLFFIVIFFIFRFSRSLVPESGYARLIYQSHQITDGRLYIKTDKGTFRISLPKPEVAEVIFYNQKLPFIDSSSAVLPTNAATSVNFASDDRQLVYGSKEMQVVIDKSPLRFAFVSVADTVLKSYRPFFDHDTLRGFSFKLDADEHIYGAGFRTTDLDLRDQHLELYNQAHYGYSTNAPNLNFSVPFVVSSAGYGLLFDNPEKGILDIDEAQANVMTFGSIGGRMTYYVIGGANTDSILNNYHQLTGYQPMPPRWALGYIQSRFGYESEAELRQMVSRMLAEGYPLDAVVVDLYWFGAGVHDSFYMGNLDWYAKKWPEPEKMIADLANRGIQTILITEPYVLPESRYFDTLSQTGMLGKNPDGSTMILDKFWFGPGGLFDIFQPRMQQWFWEKYHRQIDIGVAGWWGDLGEPENHPDSMQHVVGNATQVHNIYAHYWHKMLAENYEKYYPEVRLFNLNRAGFAGSQRYSIYPWSGDVSRSWQGLQAQPRAVLGMAMSGFPYMHSDLGGFAMGEEDAELYLRWLQYGVFNPIYRVHGDTYAPVEPYNYPDSIQKILHQFIDLRYRLMPYNYSLAWLNSTQGIPMTRPLFTEEPYNKALSDISETYLWGNDFLVAPVMEPKQTHRRLYLPKGVWFDFFNDEKLYGSRWINQPVTLQTIPVFVRGGAFIPMTEPITNTKDYSSKNLTLHYYFTPEVPVSAFTMYEDDGKTRNAFAKNQYELLHFRSTAAEDILLITLERDIAGTYKGMPAKRNITLVIHGIETAPERIMGGTTSIQPVTSLKNLQSVTTPAYWYDAANEQIMIKILWDTEKILIQIHGK